MTTILKFPSRSAPNNIHLKPIPIEVLEWMTEHPECKIPELNFHHGYHVFIFHDDVSATEFKLRFRDLFK